MDYFILVLHNPPIEFFFFKVEQGFHFKSVVLTDDCTILSAFSAFTGNILSLSMFRFRDQNVPNISDSLKYCIPSALIGC